MNSIEMRNDPLFLRNNFQTTGKWNIPLVKAQEIVCDNLSLISFSDIRTNDTEYNKRKGVHFFIDDYRFETLFDKPERSFDRLAQYSFLLTPDYSLYADMPLWRQLENVAKNRWVGAYWQSKGLTVVPTISWSTPRSYEFCFEGVEKGGTVAVGMIGCKRNKIEFMRGFDAMLDSIAPNKIIVLGSPFPEMQGNIIEVDYLASRKGVH